MMQQHVGTTSAASVGGRRLNVPRWARVAAYVVPLLTVPSGLWRLALALDVPGMPYPGQPAGQRLYVVFLSLLAEGLALLTLGLVQPWGRSCHAGSRYWEDGGSHRWPRSSPPRWVQPGSP